MLTIPMNCWTILVAVFCAGSLSVGHPEQTAALDDFEEQFYEIVKSDTKDDEENNGDNFLNIESTDLPGKFKRNPWFLSKLRRLTSSAALQTVHKCVKGLCALVPFLPPGIVGKSICTVINYGIFDNEGSPTTDSNSEIKLHSSQDKEDDDDDKSEEAFGILNATLNEKDKRGLLSRKLTEQFKKAHECLKGICEHVQSLNSFVKAVCTLMKHIPRLQEKKIQVSRRN